MSVLKVYGEKAIPLLEGKWGAETSYKALLQCCDGYNANILETIWNSRIRKNASSESKQYIRRVVTGATGSGKSQFAIDEIMSSFSDFDYLFHNYVIYVVSSVEQAIDFAKKLDREKITYEILVSQQTYDSQEDERKWWITTSSSNNKAVKIIQLSALKHNAHNKYIQNDRRRLCTMYIDELTLTDFVRPSINATNRVKAYTGIKTDTDIMTCYETQFSRFDMSYAIKLATDNDSSDFVSSMLYQSVNTTILTTEELTTVCLEELGFKKITIKKVETEALSETCTLHVSDSPYYVQQYVQSEAPNHIYDMEFDNIFANKCGFANGNLQTIKGQHLRGKNLSIIRCLPREVISSIESIFTGCFKAIDGVDPVAIFYKDSLMQAVGRSVGFRGDTEAWVMVHSSVWAMIKDSKWIYQIKSWDVEIDPERKKIIDDQRCQKKTEMNSFYVQKAKFIQDDRIARTKNALVVTGNPNDKLTKKDIKLILGEGFTLKSVAACLNVTPCRKNSSRYLEGVRKI